MKNYRVTIKHKTGEQTGVVSKTIPAYNEKQAIDKVIDAERITEVVSKKAELITLK
jgi:hypothetical protein